MKLTVVQFAEKMKAEDFRKRAKFWGTSGSSTWPPTGRRFRWTLREGRSRRGLLHGVPGHPGRVHDPPERDATASS